MTLAATLKYLGGLLGILQDDPDKWLKGNITHETSGSLVGSGGSVSASTEITRGDAWIEQQIQARLDAKKNKDWATADKIRDELKQQGIVLEDIPGGGTNWRRE